MIVDILGSSIMARKVVVVPDPAAGTDWSQAVAAAEEFGPGGWVLKSVGAQLAQGATQTPRPVLVIADAAGNVVAQSAGSSTVQAVNTTCAYTWAPETPLSGQIGATTAVMSTAPLPMGIECFLPAGWTVSVVSVGIGANSQWSKVVLYVVGVG